MDLVVIYGPPGTGKLTVSKQLAQLTGYKLFDNHASLDVIRRVFDFDDAPFWPLVFQLRYAVIEAAAQQDISLIFTMVYADPEDIDYAEAVFGRAERHGGRVCPVRLFCDIGVLEQRVEDESRSNKLHNVEALRQAMTTQDLLSPVPGRVSLEIDNTKLAPDETARRIADYYQIAKV